MPAMPDNAAVYSIPMETEQSNVGRGAMILDSQGYVPDRDGTLPGDGALYSVPTAVSETGVEPPGSEATDNAVLYCVPLASTRMKYQGSVMISRAGDEATAGDYIAVDSNAPDDLRSGPATAWSSV